MDPRRTFVGTVRTVDAVVVVEFVIAMDGFGGGTDGTVRTGADTEIVLAVGTGLLLFGGLPLDEVTGTDGLALTPKIPLGCDAPGGNNPSASNNLANSISSSDITTYGSSTEIDETVILFVAVEDKALFVVDGGGGTVIVDTEDTGLGGSISSSLLLSVKLASLKLNPPNLVTVAAVDEATFTVVACGWVETVVIDFTGTITVLFFFTSSSLLLSSKEGSLKLNPGLAVKKVLVVGTDVATTEPVGNIDDGFDDGTDTDGPVDFDGC